MHPTKRPEQSVHASPHGWYRACGGKLHWRTLHGTSCMTRCPTPANCHSPALEGLGVGLHDNPPPKQALHGAMSRFRRAPHFMHSYL
mmetsp:Transcript_47363/g.126759  ORF Transcript_47363/g.126759 Transcript_47363/m.126759 type:complete len:87 (+) Transcript_47363:41-301(+)